MKATINADIDLEILLNYGFVKIDKEKEKYSNDVDAIILSFYDYKYNLGESRRSQHYYLLVFAETREITLYATEPDGNGCEIPLHSIIFELYDDDIIVLN